MVVFKVIIDSFMVFYYIFIHQNKKCLMSKKSENGIHDILNRFNELVGCCEAHGTKYNPGRAALSMPALGALATLAQGALEEVTATGAAYDRASVARREAFAPLRPLIARVISSLKTYELATGTIDDAKGIARKSTGRRASAPAAAPAEGTPQTAVQKKISSSQTGFANQIGHVEELIELLRTEPGYTPNETELKVDGLGEFLARLRNAHHDAVQAGITYSNAITRRHAIFFGEGVGVTPIARSAKNYLKSVFGPASPAYRQVSKLRFPTRKGVAPVVQELVAA